MQSLTFYLSIVIFNIKERKRFMEEAKIQSLINKQRIFFSTNKTLDISYRIESLIRLRNAIHKYETQINSALKADLGKSFFESYMCEVGLVLSELNYMIKHIKKFASDIPVKTPLSQFHSRSFQKPSPYGTVLVVSPWNYPFLLTMDPLIDALAAGNTIILKPSAYSSNTSQIISVIISEVFPEEYVCTIQGGREENQYLLQQKFDYIFFTGSKNVGIQVLEKAARYVTPVTLELGGKSPCIVDRTANVKLAAKRIIFGKFLNCGQTCVAPDYIYCDVTIKEELVRELKKQILLQFGDSPISNKNYGNIINEKHFHRLCSYLEPSKIVHGGRHSLQSLKIEPTIMDPVSFDDLVMSEEIFGPILPVLTFSSIHEAIHKINTMEHPLALYIFTSNKQIAKQVLSTCRFGGGCINDVIIHLATSHMGFGGFGESGMGSYHGKTGFDTFTHYKSIVDKKNWLDLPIRYQPYTDLKKKLLNIFLS